jgi:hypothetical protein
MRVMSHQERIAEFDRQAEARQRQREAAAARKARQQQQGGGEQGQQQEQEQQQEEHRRQGSAGSGSGGVSSSGGEDEEGEEAGAAAAGVPMEELIARSQLEDASLNLVMEAMWAANVVDIQSTLIKVGRRLGGARRMPLPSLVEVETAAHRARPRCTQPRAPWGGAGLPPSICLNGPQPRCRRPLPPARSAAGCCTTRQPAAPCARSARRRSGACGAPWHGSARGRGRHAAPRASAPLFRPLGRKAESKPASCLAPRSASAQALSRADPDAAALAPRALGPTLQTL